VNPADGAVVAAVGAPYNVNPAPPAPADAADGNNVQNVNVNAVPAAPPVAQEVSVFLVPIFVFFPRYSGWALFSYNQCHFVETLTVQLGLPPSPTWQCCKIVSAK